MFVLSFLEKNTVTLNFKHPLHITHILKYILLYDVGTIYRLSMSITEPRLNQKNLLIYIVMYNKL